MFKDEWEAVEEYNKVFPGGFPSIPLMRKGKEKVIEIIENCIKEKKDVYKMGYLKLDNDIKY